MTDKTPTVPAAPKPARKPAKVSNSRPARWARAISEGQDAFSRATEAKEALEAREEKLREEVEADAEAATDTRADAAAVVAPPGAPAVAPLVPGPTAKETADAIDAAVAADVDMRGHQQELEAAVSDINTALEALDGLREEYQEWLNNLPESLQSSPVGDKLQEVTNLSFDSVDTDDFEGAEDTFGGAENVDLPRGFGKD